MLSSTLVMAIQNPQQSFGFYLHSDHHEYSDHGYERLHPPNATGFAPSHMSSSSSTTLPHGLPLANIHLRESQHQNTSINNLGYYSKTDASTITHKWISRQDFSLQTERLTTVTTDNDGFRDASVYLTSLPPIPDEIHPFNMHGLGPTRISSSTLSPPGTIRSHDHFFAPHPPGSGVGSSNAADLTERQLPDMRYLNTPSAMILGAHHPQSTAPKDTFQDARSLPSNIPLDIGLYPDGKNRAKNHACTMCNKCFDRPSTLRKHLLVHTGEKAFACSICGRRFGVASNMNRHAKRCALKPVNTRSRTDNDATPSNASGNSRILELPSPSTSVSSQGISPATSSPPSLPSIASFSASSLALALGDSQSLSEGSADKDMSPSISFGSPSAEILRSGSHQRNTLSPLLTLPSPTQIQFRDSSPSADSQQYGSKPKRRRRARSPSFWIPASLVGFDLNPVLAAASVPLPPVRPWTDETTGEFEERDSFDESVSLMPYHPSGWSGRLPGPALLDVEVMNGKVSLTHQFII